MPLLPNKPAIPPDRLANSNGALLPHRRGLPNMAGIIITASMTISAVTASIPRFCSRTERWSIFPAIWMSIAGLRTTGKRRMPVPIVEIVQVKLFIPRIYLTRRSSGSFGLTGIARFSFIIHRNCRTAPFLFRRFTLL